MRYSRFVKSDGRTHTVDVFDPSIYSPRPAWGQTDAELMDRIFAPNKEAWVAAGEWFAQVPDGVQNSADFAGGSAMDPAQYVNPDGTDGNGQPISGGGGS